MAKVRSGRGPCTFSFSSIDSEQGLNHSITVDRPFQELQLWSGLLGDAEAALDIEGETFDDGKALEQTIASLAARGRGKRGQPGISHEP